MGMGIDYCYLSTMALFSGLGVIAGALLREGSSTLVFFVGAVLK